MPLNVVNRNLCPFWKDKLKNPTLTSKCHESTSYRISDNTPTCFLL